MDLDLIKKYGSQLERMGWIVSFFGMMTQVGIFGFPSYNIVLGFWAVYCSFSKQGRATFGFIMLSLLSLVLDIVFCSINAKEEKSSTYTFALVMLILCMFAKISGIYSGSHFFSAIGGAYSMEHNFNSDNMYDSLGNPNEGQGGQRSGIYAAPPMPAMMKQDSSSMML